MAAQTKKSNTKDPYPVDSATRTCCGGIGNHTAECSLEPIDLDPPDPALARWEELSDWDGIVHHYGDAEKVIPFPRPAWSDPDEDDFGQSHRSTCYGSRPARVAIHQGPGNYINGSQWAPAAALVSARLWGDGLTNVNLTLTNIDAGKWRSTALRLTASEALELADVLRAAVDLIGGEK